YDIRYLLGDSDNFKIEIKPKNPKSEIGTKIQNSIETFHLQDLYNLHKDYVREIIKKAIIYNESRIDELYTQYPELFSSREEVMQMVVSNYISDEALGKRPLSKLTKDICEELGLR
ncbi:TPA: HNH endonuclease, partial [Clostridium botulinum]